MRIDRRPSVETVDDTPLVADRHRVRAVDEARRLVAGLSALPGTQLMYPVEANEIFVVLPAHVHDALQAAGAMIARIEELSRALAGDLKEPLRLGIGIHIGPAVVGVLWSAVATMESTRHGLRPAMMRPIHQLL